eukprot:1195696-Prorocentrum_minimum.AAC.3
MPASENIPCVRPIERQQLRIFPVPCRALAAADCVPAATVGLWDCGTVGLWDCGTVGLWDDLDTHRHYYRSLKRPRQSA